MLWGILNSVISARYIWRKVSGNCFVLLEQRLSDELTWFSWRFAHRHHSAASPAICMRLRRSASRAPCFSEATSLQQVLIGVKNNCIMGVKTRQLQTVASCRKGICRVPGWFWYKETGWLVACWVGTGLCLACVSHRGSGRCWGRTWGGGWHLPLLDAASLPIDPLSDWDAGGLQSMARSTVWNISRRAAPGVDKFTALSPTPK